MRGIRIASALAMFVAGLASMGVGRASPTPPIANPGCCSHHSGVCGCAGNRAQCCDGTLSPSCGC